MSIRFESLGIDFNYVPKSIRIFGYEITMLGILLAVGMLLAVWAVVRRAKRKGEDQNLYLGAACAAVPGAIIGGRLFYVAFSWSLYKSDLFSILDLRSGGMALYGALLGGALTVSLYCAIRRVSFGETADALTFGILIVQIFTRLGDFFNRESFGGYTDWACAMQMPLSSVRASEVTSEIRENLLTIDGSSWIQVHPVFLYEILWCLILLFALLILRRKKRFSGEIFMRYLAGYGFVRFFTEWLRTDQLWIPQTTIPISMVLSAALFVVCSISVSVSRSMEKKRNEARKRRRQELEDQKAAEREKEDDGPVDIEELLREEERLQREDALREAQRKAEEAGETAETENDGENTTSESGDTAEEPEKESTADEPEAAEPEEAGDDSETAEPEEADDDSETAEPKEADDNSESSEDEEPDKNSDGTEADDSDEYADNVTEEADEYTDDDAGEMADIDVDEELADVLDPEYKDHVTNPSGDGEKESPAE
jgi:phosphatidylglycerol:prolipoprotein diacylglycerol transferase